MGVQVNLGRVVGEYAKINNQPVTDISGSNGIKSEQHGSQVIFSGDPDTVQMNLGGTPNQYVGFDASGKAVPFELYGFEFDNQESDPESKIRYIVNHKNYQPARMGVLSFDYGDWANAFFIKNLRPCMVRYNGTVAYDLDKNDYTKKADGTASDIANESFAGNAMVGIPTVWIKVDKGNTDNPRVYFSNIRIDSSYHAYAHHDSNGNIMPYTYLPIYNGWVDGSGKLRSLSGKAPTTMQSGELQISEARANNPAGTDIWDIEKFVDYNLITLLLMLIGKTTNTQAAFGNGLTVSNISGVISSGTMNDKGLFWGSTSTLTSGVKVFGIENWWGNMWRRHAGLLLLAGVAYYKLTKGTEDGSTVYGFNVDDMSGTDVPGWINSGIHVTDSQGYIRSINVGNDGSILPTSFANGSASTYVCDYGWWPTLNNRKVIMLFGSNPMLTLGQAGAFACSGNYDLPSSANTICASVSCKPEVS